MGGTKQMTDEDYEFDEARRLMRKCSCHKKSEVELRYDPGVTYITCKTCADTHPRSMLPDWQPKQVVRHWNAEGYITRKKRY
jgi:hypothetical protein